MITIWANLGIVLLGLMIAGIVWFILVLFGKTVLEEFGGGLIKKVKDKKKKDDDEDQYYVY